MRCFLIFPLRLLFCALLTGMDLHCQKAVLGDTANVGINYGMVADNLPPPTEVVELLKSISISKVKIYSTNRKVLRAFRNTGISFTVGIGNEDVASLISLESAMRWLHDNVLLYLPDTQISAIAVGNEAFSGNDTILMSNVLKAMQNIYVCLSNLGLSGKIHVSTPHSLAVLQNSYPPSAGSFLPELVQPFMKPLLSLLSISGSPFMINAYPFFAYKASPSTVNLEYALFLNREGMQDRSTGLLYYGMLDAQVDAIYSAMAGLGFNNVKVIVSETGWPSRGDADEAGANLKNAQIYNSNLIRRVASMKGTPLKPNVSLEAYVFALFNENMKPGPASERHYGLFMPDGMKSYDFGLDNPMSSTLYAANDVSASSNSLARYAAFWITPALYLLSSLSGNLIAASAF